MTTQSSGWHPDPSGTTGQRYFDGHDWTEHLAPQKPAERRFTIHYGFALLAVFAMLGTVIPTLLLFSTASDPQTEGYGVTAGVLWLLWGGFWTLVWVAFAIQHTLRGRGR
jgi:hypothetical protein